MEGAFQFLFIPTQLQPPNHMWIKPKIWSGRCCFNAKSSPPSESTFSIKPTQLFTQPRLIIRCHISKFASSGNIFGGAWSGIVWVTHLIIPLPEIAQSPPHFGTTVTGLLTLLFDNVVRKVHRTTVRNSVPVSSGPPRSNVKATRGSTA